MSLLVLVEENLTFFFKGINLLLDLIKKAGRSEISVSESSTEEKFVIPNIEILNNAAQSIIMTEIAGVPYNFLGDCCRNFYYSILNEDPEEMFALEQNCSKRHNARKHRITGSRCYEIYTFRGIDWDMKSKKYFGPKSFNNKYIKHGLKYESNARQAFLLKTGIIVVKSGLIISSENKWLGFSPDGVVLGTDLNPIALLEIKCLYAGASSSIEEAIQTCSFVFKENRKYFLKRNHKYYGQIQLGLSMLNLKMCSLLLFASFDESCLIIDVEFSYEFSKNMLQKIKYNYFNKMLHIICSADDE